MNKQNYLDELRKNLEKLNVTGIDEIISEYSQHFDFKLADGFSDEEIATKLGDAKTVAEQFAEHGITTNAKAVSGKTFIYSGLGFSTASTGILFIIFAAWTLILGLSAVAILFTSGLMLTGTNIANIIPPMPYVNRFFFTLPLLALSLLVAVCTVYCCLYMKQFLKAYFRWHRNVVAAVKQKPILPSLALHPQLNPKAKRKLRNVFLITFIVFGITLIIAYAAAAIQAGAFEFWHVWQWFMG